MERFLLTKKALSLYGFPDHGSDVVLLCEVMMFLNDLFPEGGVMLALLQSILNKFLAEHQSVIWTSSQSSLYISGLSVASPLVVYSH